MSRSFLRRWRKWLIWGCAVLLSLIIFALMYHTDQKAVSQLSDQLAAQRYTTESRSYAQVSLYLPSSQEGVAYDAVTEMRLTIEQSMTDAGVPAESYPWLIALSTTSEGEVSADGTSVSVEINAYTGDFFSIHPMVLRSGWYPNEDATMHDRIVLDRQTAWNLFYTDDVAGRYVTLGEHSFEVAAVVDYDDGSYNEQAAGDVCRVWILADAPGQETASLTFDRIEIVVPEPIDGFALSTLNNAVSAIADESVPRIENDTRFGLKNRFTVLKEFSMRGISETGIIYPWYENAARLLENHLAITLVPEAILLLFPAISLLILLLILNSRRRWGFHSITDKIEDLIDQRNTRNYEAAERERLRQKELSSAPKESLQTHEDDDALKYQGE